jgi:DNA polymerase-3 subunit alpha
LIRQRHGIEFTLDTIPTDDPETYEMLGRGETAGVFQVEGSGMRRWLVEMKPKELKHVVAMVALFRPGPMDFIPGYIRRMHGEEEVEYRHPWLEEIFKETYGYPVYQEQLMFAVMKLAGYTAPEADDLRKAISKKMREKLDTHRQKFIDGAKTNGISSETASEIFSDWEEFARYGFNKSHAVDYAVIAVQTGYLKLHYPHEYMTALLSVSKNDTAKVALYTADARRIGVAVEPPEINASDWDFSIEDCGDDSAVIRFGLGAVKNVGQGAVEKILEARKDGPFKDINDFASRVDLRQVGRRALECLAKVGAMDTFGARLSILEALDRILAISASYFRAAEAGQMSLFGLSNSVVEEIPLPPVKNEINRREILNWEKELIGLYVSDHPLSTVMGELADVVTHYSSQLSEAAHEEVVRVAGIVARMRSHTTKNGKSMAFVTLEDLQGTIELVIFPRTWERVAEMVQFDQILMVDGKVDAASGEPKILVDNVTTGFNKTVGLNDSEELTGKVPGMTAVGKTTTPSAQLRADLNQKEVEQYAEVREGQSGLRSDAWQNVAEEPGPNISTFEEDWDDIPLPPEEPPDWYDLPAAVSTSEPVLARQDQPVEPSSPKGDETKSTPKEAAIQPIGNILAEPTEKPPVLIPIARKPADSEPLPNSGLPAYLVSPLQTLDDHSGIRMLTIILRSSGDKTRDVLRLRRIHGLILTYPGEDRFAVQVIERGRSYLLEFPNYTTKICQELLDRLKFLVGLENIRVEPITFQ